MSGWKKIKDGWLLVFKEQPPEFWTIDAPTDIVPNSALNYNPAVIPVIKTDFGALDKTKEEL